MKNPASSNLLAGVAAFALLLTGTAAAQLTVEAPANNATVNSPFYLQAKAPSCDGNPTASMAYSYDQNTDHIFSGAQSMQTTVTIPANGAHILHVKAWSNIGSLCENSIDLNVSASAGLVPPSGASQYDHLENDQNYTGSYASCGGANGPNTNLWQTQPDCGTPGSNAGSTTTVSTPIYGSNTLSREYTMSYTASGGGVRWFDAKAASDSATHFLYDAYVYVTDVSSVMNLEMDMNHAITSPLRTVYILATQCDLSLGVWQVTTNKVWVNTNAPCDRSQVTSGVWHHFQMQTHHDANGGVGIYYDAVAVDGNVFNITSCTNQSTGASVSCESTSENLGWGGVIGPNFQIDGNGNGGTATAYTDNFTIYYW
jgi:hypothetical protein